MPVSTPAFASVAAGERRIAAGAQIGRADLSTENEGREAVDAGQRKGGKWKVASRRVQRDRAPAAGGGGCSARLQWVLSDGLAGKRLRQMYVLDVVTPVFACMCWMFPVCIQRPPTRLVHRVG